MHILRFLCTAGVQECPFIFICNLYTETKSDIQLKILWLLKTAYNKKYERRKRKSIKLLLDLQTIRIVGKYLNILHTGVHIEFWLVLVFIFNIFKMLKSRLHYDVIETTTLTGGTYFGINGKKKVIAIQW